MSKFTYTPLTTLTNESSAVSQINANFATLQAIIEQTLSRNGSTPNTVATSVDMNSNRLVNLPVPVNSSEPVRLAEFNEAVFGGVASGNIVVDYVTRPEDFKGANDTIKIQAALDAIKTAGGGRLFAAGLYFADSLTFDCSVPIIIDGGGTGIIKANDTTVSKDVLSLNVGSTTLRQAKVLIQDLSIQGNSNQNRNGLNAAYLANLIMRNCALFDHGGWGYKLDNCYGHLFDHVACVNNTLGGGYLQGASGNSSTHLRCQYNANAGKALMLEKGDVSGPHFGFNLIGCDIELNLGVGLYTTDCVGMVALGCYFEQNAGGDWSIPENGNCSSMNWIGGTPFGFSQWNNVNGFYIGGQAWQAFPSDAHEGIGLQLVNCTAGTFGAMSFPNGGTINEPEPAGLYDEPNAFWKTFTPTFACLTGAAPSIGNGNLTGLWRKVGNTVDVTINLTIGSTTDLGGGAFQIGLPFTSRNLSTAMWFGDCQVDAAAGMTFYKAALFPNNASFLIRSGAGWGGASSFGTLASGDIFRFQLRYEA